MSILKRPAMMNLSKIKKLLNPALHDNAALGLDEALKPLLKKRHGACNRYKTGLGRGVYQL
ncbi:MAG: hypothetical protein PVI13_05380, partial [Desulfobacterales bacterium]